MSTLIFRAMAPIIAIVMVLFSLIILLRGHNDPGGGFIGGLIAASAAATYGMAHGVGAVRRILRFNPLGYAGAGVLLAGTSGFVALFFGTTFLTAHWLPFHLFGVPGVFDIGVYLVVFGTLTAVTLALEDSDEEEGT